MVKLLRNRSIHKWPPSNPLHWLFEYWEHPISCFRSIFCSRNWLIFLLQTSDSQISSIPLVGAQWMMDLNDHSKHNTHEITTPLHQLSEVGKFIHCSKKCMAHAYREGKYPFQQNIPIKYQRGDMITSEQHLTLVMLGTHHFVKTPLWIRFTVWCFLPRPWPALPHWCRNHRWAFGAQKILVKEIYLQRDRNRHLHNRKI